MSAKYGTKLNHVTVVRFITPIKGGISMFGSQEKVKCWELKDCSHPDCPAYESEDLRCWLFSGTLCHNRKQGDFVDKIEVCLTCEMMAHNLDPEEFPHTMGFIVQHVNEIKKVMARQAEDILDLSTPVMKIWDGVLLAPVVGTLDSSRAQTVMGNLLTMIVETQSRIAIIDVTGVPIIDSLVASHLFKTVNAARLLGAKCILTGISPTIAQTMVQLGVDVGALETRATIYEALCTATDAAETVARRSA